MDANKYVRDKIAADKDLYLHEEHSVVNHDGVAAFVVSSTYDRAGSAVMTTKGLPDDDAKAKALLDERLGQVVATINDGLKRKGLA